LLALSGGALAVEAAARWAPTVASVVDRMIEIAKVAPLDFYQFRPDA